MLHKITTLKLRDSLYTTQARIYLLFIPHIIDIEASGFGYSSYPIEVGIILANGENYCTLIKPEPDWVHWSSDAEKIHHISQHSLKINSKPVIEVAKELNRLLLNKTVYSDGWVVDKPWVNKLFSAAKIPQSFSISPLEFILKEHQMNSWETIKNQVINELCLTRHRASSDARIIQETFKRTSLD